MAARGKPNFDKKYRKFQEESIITVRALLGENHVFYQLIKLAELAPIESWKYWTDFRGNYFHVTEKSWAKVGEGNFPKLPDDYQFFSSADIRAFTEPKKLLKESDWTMILKKGAKYHFLVQGVDKKMRHVTYQDYWETGNLCSFAYKTLEKLVPLLVAKDEGEIYDYPTKVINPKNLLTRSLMHWCGAFPVDILL